MLIDIDKIIVGDRIRKDFGDLEELAEDIRQNTLLNALVVTPSGNGDGTYTLIAGERRLRAMRDILGYKAVPANSVGAEDSEHALLMEISENECRKEFTKTERLDYARRLVRIEAAKAEERQTLGVKNPQGGKAREKVAKALGVSDKTIRQEQFIEDNRDLLDPADFADWDEGKLSTNKAFQRIKAAKAQAERELEDARANEQTARSQVLKAIRERDEARRELTDAYHEADEMDAEMATLRRQVEDARAEVAALERQNDELYAQKNPEPQVVTREVEVVREVESEQSKRRIAELEHEQRIYLDTDQKLRRQLESTRKELDRAKGILGMDKGTKDVQRDVEYLISATNQYVRHYGGLTWTFERVKRPVATEYDGRAKRRADARKAKKAAFRARLAELREAGVTATTFNF